MVRTSRSFPILYVCWRPPMLHVLCWLSLRLLCIYFVVAPWMPRLLSPSRPRRRATWWRFFVLYNRIHLHSFTLAVAMVFAVCLFYHQAVGHFNMDWWPSYLPFSSLSHRTHSFQVVTFPARGNISRVREWGWCYSGARVDIRCIIDDYLSTLMAADRLCEAW